MPEPTQARLSCRAGIARAGISRAGYVTGTAELDRLPGDQTGGGTAERASPWTLLPIATTTWTEVTP